jgi:CxxC-x17-CxxC domain-containing protein
MRSADPGKTGRTFITAAKSANKLFAYILSRKALIKREDSKMYEDKTLVCKECGKEFVFTAGEQEFYAERGFQNEPQRCKACRDARKNAARGPREYFTAVCAACGGEAKVPFEPKSDRPVYCSECFAKMREQA